MLQLEGTPSLQAALCPASPTSPSPRASAPPWRLEKFGAAKRTRTSTPVKELAPQASASTSSAMAAHSRKPMLAKARRLTNRPGDDKGDCGRGAQGEPAQEDAQKQVSQGRPSSCPASPRPRQPGGAFGVRGSIPGSSPAARMTKRKAWYLHPCIA